MAAAVPFVISAIGGASGIKTARDARKSQKDMVASQEQLTRDAAKGQEQGERSAVDLFRRRRRTSGAGFSDVGATSGLLTGGGTQPLGQ